MSSELGNQSSDSPSLSNNDNEMEIENLGSTSINLDDIKGILMASIREDMVKLGKGSKDSIEHSILDISSTIEDVDGYIDQLKSHLAERSYPAALAVLLHSFVNKHPNKRMIAVKCAIAMITLDMSNPSKDQIRDALNLLLRCKCHNIIDDKSGSVEKSIKVEMKDGSDQDIVVVNLLDGLLRKFSELETCDYDPSQDYNKGLSLYKKDQYEDALSYFLTAITKSTDSNGIAIRGMAECAVKIGNTGLLMDTLAVIESDTSELNLNLHKMRVLSSLLHTEGLSTLSIMSFHCNLVQIGGRIISTPDNTDWVNECTGMIDKANKLIQSKVDGRQTISGMDVFDLMKCCRLSSNTIKAAKKVNRNRTIKTVTSIDIKNDADRVNEDSLMSVSKYWMEVIETLQASSKSPEEKLLWFIEECKGIMFRLINVIESTKCGKDIVGTDSDGHSFTAMKEGDTYIPNISDGPSEDVLFVLFKNWASELCDTWDDSRGFMSKVARNNGCINAFLTFIVYLINKESGGVISDELLDKVNKGIAFIDKHITVVKKNKTRVQEHKQFLTDSEITEEERSIIPGLLLVSHALVADLKGRKLRVSVPSAEAWRSEFDSTMACITSLLFMFGKLPHGETINTPKTHLSPSSFNDQDFDCFNQIIIGLYTVFSDLDVSSVSTLWYTIAQRVPLSHEDKLAFLALVLASRKRVGAMRTQAMIAVKAFMSADSSLSQKEAIEHLARDWGESSAAALYQGSIDGHKAAVESYYNEHEQECIKYWSERNVTEDNITFEHKESYRAHCGGEATAKLFVEAFKLIADDKVGELASNQMALLLNQKVDEEELPILQKTLAKLTSGEELSDEESDVLDGLVDEKWDNMLDELKNYKKNVFDADPANNEKPFFVSHSINPALYYWSNNQIKLYDNVNWRDDNEHIIKCLSWNNKESVNDVRKCILERRRQKLKSLGWVSFDYKATKAAIAASAAANMLDNFEAQNNENEEDGEDGAAVFDSDMMAALARLRASGASENLPRDGRITNLRAALDEL